MLRVIVVVVLIGAFAVGIIGLMSCLADYVPI